MLRKTTLAIATIFLSCTLNAQTTYLQLGYEDYHILDRLETRSGKLSNDLFLSVKPVSRKRLVSFLEKINTDSNHTELTAIDEYNIEHAISTSGEWADDEDGAIDSRRPILKHFYKKQPELIYVKNDNFFFAANPVLTAIGVYDKNGPKRGLFTSNRGLEARGWIAKKVGFYTFFTDNQESPPYFVREWVDTTRAVPGADYFKRVSNTKYDYLLARGYIDIAAIKDHINITFGYDKQYWGDGQRSLFLSDFSAPAAFLRINTRIWKFNYQNLYLELTPDFKGYSNVAHKYATMHHLSINATKWLNVGIFESVIFGRKDRYEFGYMNPIILYRQVERAMGSPDNVLLGINFKAIAAKRLQLYGQLLLDEFKTKELFGGNGWWANKVAAQIGGKYFDAFTVKNLDLQAEFNIVRPFTYTHYDSVANYTHYNQPIAHPLGADFMEVRGTATYQPIKNLYLTAEGMIYSKGSDTGSANFGNNIFDNYENRSVIPGQKRDYGYKMITGIGLYCILANLNASYELRENLFIDLGVTYRRYYYNTDLMPTDAYIQTGIRLNFARRNYNFW
ncbi:MAG: hypothetical protein EOP56_11575 [Sphingobacteriales bacterium]|nr:MAG: hypothetical protein EOP56_11575 [Sphingobacteriales bacterium]